MPHLSIRWKGRPYRRFPRIRLASTPRHSLRTRSQTAAEDVTRSPLSTELERERTKQKIKSKARRSLRSSKNSSALVPARKRVSRRARQRIQIFGWNTEIASKASTEKLGHKHLSTIAVRGSRFVTADGARSGVDFSFDGAASSIIRNSGRLRHRHPPLLGPAIRRPVQYRSVANFSSGRTSANTIRANQAWSSFSSAYERTEANSLTTKRQAYDGTHNIKRRQANFCRTELKGVEKRRPQAIYRPSQRHASTSTRRGLTITEINSNKSRVPTRGSRAFWDAVDTIALKTGHTIANKASLESIVQTFQGEAYTRTPSQKKKLKRFVRELELYVQAAKSLPKQSLTVSISSTSVSACTIEALKPYHAEFQAAGLAVTSLEQQRMSTISPRNQSYAPATPPKDKKWVTKKAAVEKSRMNPSIQRKAEAQNLSPSTSSYTTGTDVIVFTPPHETSYFRPNHSLSDVLKVSALPAGTTPGSASAGKPSSPRSSPKRSLPWLRTTGNSSPTDIRPVKRDTPGSSGKVQNSGGEGYTLSPRPIIPKRSTSRRRVDLRPPEEKALEAKRISDFGEPRKHDSTYEESSRHRQQDSNTAEIKRSTREFANASTQTNFIDLMPNRISSVESSIDENAVIDCYISPANRRRNTEVTRHSYEDYLYEVHSRTSKHSSTISNTTVQADRSRRGSASLPVTGVIQTDECKSIDAERLKGVSPTRQPPPPPKYKNEQSLGLTYQTTFLSPRNSEHEPRKATVTPPNLVRNSLHKDCIFDSFQCQQCIPREDAARPFTPSESPPEIDQSRRHERSSSVKTELEEACIRSDGGDVSGSSKQGFGKQLELKLKAEPTLSTPVSPDKEHSRQKSQTTKRSPSPSLPLLPPPSSTSSLPILIELSSSLIPTPQPTTTCTIVPPPPPFTDTAILRGLKVATAAACDEEVDQWIEEVMGSGVRKFLADLGRFDGLGVNGLAERVKRSAEGEEGEIDFAGNGRDRRE